MSWPLRHNAQDMDNQCPGIVDQWIVFNFHLDICQQCPDIDHRYLLFSAWLLGNMNLKSKNLSLK